MYAIIKTGGKQYRVAAGDKLNIEKLDAEVGAKVELTAICVIDGDKVIADPAEAAATKVVATVGFYNEWDNGKMEIYNAKGELAYTVFQASNEFAVVNTDGDFVRFPVNSKGQIDTKGILINDKWLITFGSQNKSEVDFWNISRNVWASADADTFKEVNAIYEDIFGFLGFKFAECNYMTAAHFEKFFGTIGEVSASYPWNAGMVVVNPVTPELPQTGDNASIVGFAMIAVALVAAAVVTVKKVRA